MLLLSRRGRRSRRKTGQRSAACQASRRFCASAAPSAPPFQSARPRRRDRSIVRRRETAAEPPSKTDSTSPVATPGPASASASARTLLAASRFKVGELPRCPNVPDEEKVFADRSTPSWDSKLVAARTERRASPGRSPIFGGRRGNSFSARPPATHGRSRSGAQKAPEIRPIVCAAAVGDVGGGGPVTPLVRPSLLGMHHGTAAER